MLDVRVDCGMYCVVPSCPMDMIGHSTGSVGQFETFVVNAGHV